MAKIHRSAVAIGLLLLGCCTNNYHAIDIQTSKDSSNVSASSSSWIPSQHISSWYTPFDQCLLNTTTRADLKRIAKDCENLHPEAASQPIRCRVGNTWPSKSEYCSPADIAFSNRTNFLRTLDGYDDPSKSPLKSFFEKLSKENGALLLVGDSVMQQFFSAIACELEREQVWKDPTKFSNTDEVQNVRVPDAKLSSVVKFLPIYHFVNGRYDRIPHAAMHLLQKSVQHYLAVKDSLVIVMNMGLHYVDNPIPNFSRKDYQKQVLMGLQYLHKVALETTKKKVRILWRETSAQHFPTFNGYWPGAKFAHTMTLTCTPIADPSPEADWRNYDVRELVSKNNLSTVQIVPFYNVTLPLWSEHPNGQLRDCTHFCWTPMLYQSIFHFMDRAMSSS